MSTTTSDTGRTDGLSPLDLAYPLSPQPGKGLKLLGTLVLTLPRHSTGESAEPASLETDVDPELSTGETTTSVPTAGAVVSTLVPAGVRIVAYGGSVMEFVGGCMVNAANSGGVTGFGIDEMVNKAGGHQLIEYRRGFGGIPTGEAKISPSFKHSKVKAIVHATGPHYHRDLPGMPKMTYAIKSHAENDILLASAYRNALKRAAESNLGSIGYCLLSAGVFKGPRSLDEVIRVGLEAIKAEVYEMLGRGEPRVDETTAKDGVSSSKQEEEDGHSSSRDEGVQQKEKADNNSQEKLRKGRSPSTVVREIALFAFTPEEQKVLAKEFATVFGLTLPTAGAKKSAGAKRDLLKK